MRFPILILLVALLLSGCSSAKVAIHRPSQHYLLHWGLIGYSDVPSLDPALAADATSISLTSLIYGGLVRLDSHLHVVPDGASHWTIDHGGRVYTFFIRRHLQFADGNRVTAKHFAQALERSLGPAGEAGTASFYLSLIAHRMQVGTGPPKTVQGISVLSPTSLRITLSQPAAHFLSELAFPGAYVAQPGLEQRYGPTWTDHAAGFGPYRVQVWRHSRYLKLVRNPYYYGGVPRIKQILVSLYSTENTALKLYHHHGLDLISGLQTAATLSHQPMGVRRVPGMALDYLAFNTSRPLFHEQRVRFALAASIQNLDEGLAGTAFPSQNFLPSAFGIAVPQWKPILKPGTYLDATPYRQRGKFPQIALVIPHDERLNALAHQLSDAWQVKLGINIRVRQLNLSDYSRVLNTRAFDLAIVRWGADYPDPQDFLGTQLGPSHDNVTGWSGGRFTRMVALADSYAPSDKRRILLFEQAARAAAARVPLVPLDEPAQTAIMTPKLSGVALTPFGTIVAEWQNVRLVA